MRTEEYKNVVKLLVMDVSEGKLILQPDYQRGDVWTSSKKKMLIDSLLRGWSIPPIHIIDCDDGTDEVLDGQQRLRSIVEFIDNKFRTLTESTPYDPFIEGVGGVYFKDLPIHVQERILKFTITVIRLSDYMPDEPSELFYRLNLPTTLTPAEKLNTYMGETRSQVNKITNYFEESIIDKSKIGFSNRRLQYNDLIARYLYTLETNTLSKKIYTRDMVDLYREGTEFSQNIIEIAYNSIDVLSASLEMIEDIKIRKASLFSWLVFYSNHYEDEEVVDFLSWFEQKRLGANEMLYNEMGHEDYDLMIYSELMRLFSKKLSLASTDSSSIIIRDIVLNIMYSVYINENGLMKQLIDYVDEGKSISTSIELLIEKTKWGSEIIETS